MFFRLGLSQRYRSWLSWMILPKDIPCWLLASRMSCFILQQLSFLFFLCLSPLLCVALPWHQNLNLFLKIWTFSLAQLSFLVQKWLYWSCPRFPCRIACHSWSEHNWFPSSNFSSCCNAQSAHWKAILSFWSMLSICPFLCKLNATFFEGSELLLDVKHIFLRIELLRF